MNQDQSALILYVKTEENVSVTRDKKSVFAVQDSPARIALKERYNHVLAK